MDRPRGRSFRGVVAGACVLASVTFALSACATGMEPDCIARVRYDGALYDMQIRVDPLRAPAGEALGTAEIVDCGSLDRAVAVASVKLVELDGVDPSVAVLVRARGPNAYRGLYVAEDIERSAWPAALRDVVKRYRKPPPTPPGSRSTPGRGHRTKKSENGA